MIYGSGTIAEEHTWMPCGRTTIIPALNSPLLPRGVLSLLSLDSGDSSAFRFLEAFLPFPFAVDLGNTDKEEIAEGIVDEDELDP